VDELCFGPGQCSFKPLLSLLVSIKGIPDIASVGLTSFLRHGNEKNGDHNDDDVVVTTPKLRLVWLVRAEIEMGEAMAKFGDIYEDGRDNLLH